MLVSEQIVQATRVKPHLQVGICFYPIEQSWMNVTMLAAALVSLQS
jgi:hypothetical protein